MRTVLAMLAALALGCAAMAEEYGDAEPELGVNYVAVAGAMRIPQGSGRVPRRSGAEARIGRYLTDNLAVEAGAAWMEDEVGFAADALWHLQGWEAWGMLFGYERFDPFLTFGARGWTGGEIGPSAGVGAYYHLDAAWSLRFAADATLGLDTAVEADYTLSLGMSYSF